MSKKILKIGGSLLLIVFLFSTPIAAKAQKLPGGWVCCQSISTGCYDILGNYWPEDYKRYAETCPGGIGII